MTEPEWLSSTDPLALLTALYRPAQDRKIRLFLVACGRAIDPLLLHHDSRAAIEATAQYLERLITDDEFDPFEIAAESAVYRSSGRDDGDRAYFVQVIASIEHLKPYPELLSSQHRFLSLPFLRDIFGNPFRPVAFDPSWRTSAAVGLATSMYDSRDFGAMPILAEALEEAGCDSAEVLGHCRGGGPHVRGCWVVDLVLGKS